MTKPAFVGGALSFKGDKKKKAKKKSRKSKHRSEEAKRLQEEPAIVSRDGDDDLTEAERRAMKRKMEKEKEDLEKLAAKSHRERIEEFNQKLGELTEHNDIPRVSAAGNG